MKVPQAFPWDFHKPPSVCGRFNHYINIVSKHSFVDKSTVQPYETKFVLFERSLKMTNGNILCSFSFPIASFLRYFSLFDMQIKHLDVTMCIMTY